MAFAIHSQVPVYLFLFDFDNGYTSLNSGDSSNASQDEIGIFLFRFAKLFQFLFIKMNQNYGLWLKAQPCWWQVTSAGPATVVSLHNKVTDSIKVYGVLG